MSIFTSKFPKYPFRLLTLPINILKSVFVGGIIDMFLVRSALTPKNSDNASATSITRSLSPYIKHLPAELNDRLLEVFLEFNISTASKIWEEILADAFLDDFDHPDVSRILKKYGIS